MSRLLCWNQAARKAKSTVGKPLVAGAVLGLLGVVIAAWTLFSEPVEGQSGNERPEEGESCSVFQLQGPNDGEPINSRQVRLKLETDYEGYASISILVNNVYVYSRSLSAGATRDERTGHLVTDVVVDLEQARKSTGNPLLGTDATPITVKVNLYRAFPFALVTFDTWKGAVVRPWLELVPSLASAPGAPARTSIIIHTLRGDTYLFVFASHRKDLLALSPESPRLIRDARMLAGRVCDPNSAGKRTRDIVYEESPVDSMGRPIYVVLWTYDDKNGWKCSTILPLPR